MYTYVYMYIYILPVASWFPAARQLFIYIYIYIYLHLYITCGQLVPCGPAASPPLAIRICSAKFASIMVCMHVVARSTPSRTEKKK